jgi:hypothetical protein
VSTHVTIIAYLQLKLAAQEKAEDDAAEAALAAHMDEATSSDSSSEEASAASHASLITDRGKLLKQFLIQVNSLLRSWVVQMMQRRWTLLMSDLKLTAGHPCQRLPHAAGLALSQEMSFTQVPLGRVLMAH